MKGKSLFATLLLAFSASAVTLADDTKAVYAAGKMETSVWEAAAATYMHEFHYTQHTDHDNQRFALMDIENDIATFEASLALLKVEAPGQKEKLEKITALWAEFKANSATIIGMLDDGSADHHHMHMKLWNGAEMLNAEIEAVIMAIMK